MGHLFPCKCILLACFGLLGISSVFAQASEDLVLVLDGQQISIAYYKSSIKNLPPDWKKVWVITNRKSELETPDSEQKVESIRRNILFNCLKNTYSTLATVRYSELNAMGKPNLQTDTGFDTKEEAVPDASPLAIIKSQVCGS